MSAQCHRIKILKEYADAVLSGKKTFEVRKNDRNYRVGDLIRFSVEEKETVSSPFLEDGAICYTAPCTHPLNDCVFKITYVLNGGEYGIDSDYVVLGIKPVSNAIYTHDEAMLIIERLEDVLISHNICVPSPEDDERDPDDMVGLYGSTYSELLDAIESDIIYMLQCCKDGAEIVTGEFSGEV